MSGRALRRLPVLALAKYIGLGNVALAQVSSTNDHSASAGFRHVAPIEVWLDGIEMAVGDQSNQQENLL